MNFLQSFEVKIRFAFKLVCSCLLYTSMYGDHISKAMKAAIDETERRRAIQNRYNEEHGITPQTIKKSVRAVIEATKPTEEEGRFKGKKPLEMTTKELKDFIKELEAEMKQAAAALQFERAAQLRDQLMEYKVRL